MDQIGSPQDGYPPNSYHFPTGKSLVETTTLTPSPHLTSTTDLSNPDYLRLVLTSRVYEIVKETPLQKAGNLSAKLNNNILLKREDLHEVFSFKIRGAYNKIAHLTEEEKKRGVIACSAGNHAQGVAMSAKHLGLPAIIVMPLATPNIKWKNVKRLGAEVVLYGNDFDEAKEECVRLTKLHHLTNIPPYDDPYVIAGQGTIAMEILRQHNLNEIDAIFACIGGGGLISGIGSYVKRLCPKIKIIGVETYDANAMTLSLKEKKRVTLDEVGLFADGAAVRVVGEETFRLCSEVIDEVINVTNDEICAAIKDIFEDTRSVVEPAGALSVAGVKKYIAENNVTGGCFVVVTSGANMNFERLRFVAERAKLGERTEALFSVIIPERPGSFIQLCDNMYPRQITEFSYSLLNIRNRYSDPEKAWIYMSVEVEDREKDLPSLLEKLEANGYNAQDISDNEMAKSHARYLVGGRSKVENEQLYRFEFPERPGALKKFLSGLRSDWNISLFHYRNHGSDIGKVLVGIQVPPQDSEAFENFKNRLGYHVINETENPVYKQFLRYCQDNI
ncbi:tryptophan synthase beta subunit-like PLP-dependent enzyme [Gigaspora rosea]|uniref:Threonine dehydratase n=1 Tax=Gigaspora rosea TaxID=44941 RepID=A0A397UYR7_9GLOM|nr:tryptophan synthase beta subunit-like PLP-dependent enzyme [Gigaspora rosea]